MAAIASRTFVLAPTTDKYLSLSGEEYLRKLTIGNNWTTLRLGMMCAITPDGTNNLASCALQLGVCTADATAASTTNYVGFDFFCTNAGAAQNATYSANGTLPYFRGSSTLGNFRRRVGTTDTNTGVANDLKGAIVTNTGTLQRRTPFYVDITKGSPNYTLRPWFASVNSLPDSANRDWSLAQFLTGFETATPTPDGIAMTSWDINSSTTLACSEVAGNFDTVSVWWNRSFPLEVYALAVAKLA